MNDIETIKSHSYGGHSLQYQVLLDDIDVTEYVIELDPINTSLDFPTLHHYRIGECSITFRNDDDSFSINNSENFFTDQDQLQNGQGTSAEIKGGYEGTLITLLKGKVISVDNNNTEAIMVIGDEMHTLFSQQIEDFGVEKQFHIDEADEETINGIYNLPEYVLPLSTGSTTVSSSVNNTLTEVSELSRSGSPNRDNFAVTNRGIEVEGGNIENPATGYPQIETKSPYRYRTIEQLLKDLVGKVGITETTIEIPDIDIDNHFSSNGRVAYDIIGTQTFGTSNVISWQGFVTSWIYESGSFYILYNPRRRDVVNRAILLQYTVSTQQYTILHRASNSTTFTTEYWQLAKNGNEIAILATDAGTQRKVDGVFPEISTPATGSYNAAESGNRVYIFSYNISTKTTRTLVQKNAALKAQLANHYILGQTHGDYRSLNLTTSALPQRPPYDLPDSRRKLIWYNNMLYYNFVSTTHVGVARIGLTSPAVAVDSVLLDKSGNEMGCHFDIDNGQLVMVINVKRSEDSSIIVNRTVL